MTVSTTVNKRIATGDNSTVNFAFTFPFFKNSEIEVYLDGVLQTEITDYTLTNDDPGGTVTFLTAPGTSVQVLIKRVIPLTQVLDYIENDNFPAESHEEGLDRLVMIVQQQQEILNRALRLVATSEIEAPEIADLAGNTGKVLRVNASEDGIELVDAVGGGSLALPIAIPEGGTAATTKSGARTSLGLAIGSDVQAWDDDLDDLAALTPADGNFIVGDGTDWNAESGATVLESIGYAQRGHIDGLKLSNNTTDAQHDIDIAVGEAADDTATPADRVIMRLDTAITKQLDVNWSVGNGAGGLDIGTIAIDTWYHVWLIRRSDTGVVDVLFSASATAPTMPTNYDQKRRIGAVLTDGSANIIGFTQVGDEFLWDVPVSDYSTANPGTSAVTPALSVPTGISVLANITVRLSDSTPVASTLLLITSPQQTNTTPTTTLSDILTLVDSEEGSVSKRVITDTSSQIRLKLTNSDADVVLRVMTNGWVDPRGRDG